MNWCLVVVWNELNPALYKTNTQSNFYSFKGGGGHMPGQPYECTHVRFV
jgi:hypothetical protein